ncbi:hypothetical protein PTH_1497 [Pelotomaculum thermopropionicum SI]|uniref:Uncharacterized protein n=1 Tax=Pelotomaculum thermopropionicum (strain DSM 13744 / JCM 10971 / SI) TaxID=370438 RepID=A5D242_PELTS|nr:hypothetical protein PTH_1497 [Pelotomaculum thermopropionicum SI]
MADIRDYYRKNFLYESHRLMLPELREKVVHTCSRCKFFITVVGRSEARPGCAALIPQYARTARRVPEKLDAAELLRVLGRDGLERVLAGAAPHRQACGLFQPRA